MQQIAEGFRPSPQQARLWLFQQQSNTYQGRGSVLIEGQLDAARFQHALETVLMRHEIYRTCLHRVPGLSIPVQVINTTPLYSWSYVDLKISPLHDQKKQIEHLLQEEKTITIDVERGPLLYSTLLALTERTYIWSLHLSALHADPQTLQNLIGEVTRCYHSSAEQTHDVIQYLQFSEWQHALLQEDSEDEKAYWKTKDFSAFSTVSLPFTTQSKQQRPFAPDSLEIPLGLAEYARLEAMLEKQQPTLPVFLLTCWYILLWKLTGSNEIPLSVNIDGRIEDLLDTAGLIAKSLPLVCSFNSQQTFRELLVQVQDAYDDLLPRHPYFHWDQLEGAIGSASFSSPFNFEWREQSEPLTTGTVSFTLQQWESYSEPFQVKLVVLHGSAGLRIQFHFDRSLFDIQHIQHMADQFSLLITQIVAQPQQELGMLDILSQAERQQLLLLSHEDSRAYPHDLCLHQLFEQQVARTPDAIAIESGQDQLTYHQLNQRAHQLACYLQHQGVGPDVLVGIGLEQSLALIIAILGVLKAGGAYVPLDITYPKKRLIFIMESAHISILVTNSYLRADLPTAQQVISLDNDWESISHSNDLERPLNTIQPTNLAYVIYTSGSTGQPKGVMIPHQGLVHYVDWSSKQYAVATGTGSPVHSPLSFDLTVTSLFPSLIVGRRLVLVADAPGVEGLREILSTRNAFSLLKITPAHLNILGQSLQPGEFVDATHALIIGGEALHSESLRVWRQYAPSTRLINEYGPTETVVGCCTYEVPQDEELVGVVPIGRPLPNTQIYLLDTHLRMVPFGTPGELYIGGVGLGRGYLNRPDLTAERFIANPFSREAGTRLYKTGDMARYVSTDGTLEYLGRIDTQVKLRGYRIEVAEIEAILRQHPTIRDCAVLLQEEGPTGPRLIGYIVARTTSGLTSEALSETLKQSLPAYMVPSTFVFLEGLPLTPNGKVDRQQLSQAKQVQTGNAVILATPRSPLEDALLTMWKDLLALPVLGIHDNFFTLGGHSLLATRLIAQIRTVLQVELPVKAVFEAPTIAALTHLIEQALHNNEALPQSPLVARERPEELPLSYAQQRLWFLDQLEPGSITYLVPSTLDIHGVVDTHYLEQAFEGLISRHESLRTTFEERAGQSVQVVHPAHPYMVPVIDLQLLGQEQREQEAQRLASQETQRPCDLVQGPLLRVYLLRLEREVHVLLLTLHHIITDGWSNEVLVHELTTLYRSLVAGQPSPLAPLPIQYADYALWQRDWLQGEILEAHLAYWRERLTGVPPLEMPTDRPRPTLRTSRGSVQSLRLSASVSEALAALSRQEHVTLFMTLLAAFQLLLQRYSGQDDFSVGTPIANRRHAEIEGLIGFFVNTLVLRTDLSGNPTFTEVLHRVREVCLGAYAHQDVPFEHVVEALTPTRDLSRSPLFQVMLLLENRTQAQAQDDLANVQVEMLGIERVISKFDLTLSLTETGHGLHCALEYSTDLFEAQTITRLLGHWQTLLEGIVQNPQAPLWELPLLSAEEQELQLEHWNATTTPYPAELCVHQLFEQQVQRTPDTVALVVEEHALTYAELNRRANQLAQYLRAMGVGPEVPVGVCLQRSFEMIIALLGVLKAGGAYLPLDSASPDERLAFMLADAQAPVLLTHQSLRSRLSSYPGHVLSLDSDWTPRLAQLSGFNEENTSSPHHLAYIIYTSGSTGQPKGVCIPHKAIVRLVKTTQYADLTAKEVLLQLAPVSFDAATFEIWGSLLNGARLVLFPAQILSLEDLASVLQRSHITTLWLTAGLFHQMIAAQIDGLSSVEQLLVGGDTLSVSHVLQALEKLTMCRLINGYGPTENTTFTCCYPIPKLHPPTLSIPIGRPIANTTVYVLDRQMQPVPLGVVGELYTSGDGLARGYLNHPDLTAERFLPHPLSTTPGERLYNTGDLVRYLPDGTLEFLGRNDQQVKIRGYRIELGEIEAMLREYPVVQDAVVLAREDVPGDKRLAAYVVLHAEQTLSMSALRSFLQDRLPAYMLPAHIVVLDALPLTPNGKVDRKRLPPPEGTRPDLAETFVGPRTPMEHTLASIWSQVLRVDQIGIHDNFFTLGGDSILSLQVIARARQAGLHLTVKQLFQQQSIAALSRVITTTDISHTQQSLITGPVRLTPIQHWFFARHLPTPSHFNQAIVLHTPQPVRLLWLEQALHHLILHHDALRLRFFQHADDWQQEIAGPPTHPVLRCVDLSAISHDEHPAVMTTLAETAQASLDLSAGLLLQALCVRRGDDAPDLLLLIIHHLAIDGVSWRILAADLETAYGQLSRQEPILLADKTTSWQHWTQRLWQYAQSASVRAELPFWKASCDLLMPTLPIDRIGGSNTIASSATVQVSLSPEHTQALLHEVPAAYHTQINEVLLTALVMAFASWTGQPRLLVDLEGHGREDVIEDVDLSRTVGWFTTIFPVLLDLEPTFTPGDALKRVKESLRQIPHKGLGYGLLRHLCQDASITQQMTTLPQAQVVFNYLGQFDGSLPEASLFSLADAPTGSTHSPLEPRDHLLEINGSVMEGQLHLSWHYSREVHHHETIEHVAHRFIEALTELIAHCQSPEAGGSTPSDFPLAALTQPQLDHLLHQIPAVQQGRSGERIEDIYPLSPMQAGLLFHSLYAPEAGVYCIQTGWTLQGDLNVEAWQYAWQLLIERHSILRTCFLWHGLPQPLQVVFRQGEVPWTQHDWRSLPQDEQQRRLQALPLEHELKRADLEHAPLLRLVLARLGEQTCYFHLSIHHLIIDGWSQQRLLQEVQEAYVALTEGRVPTFSPTRPYRDYIAWVQQQDTQQAEHFWRTYLHGLTTPTPLPGSIAAATSSSGSQMALSQQVCSDALTASLRQHAQQLHLTLNTIVQGAWGLLLSAYSGETDVVFGATTTGRPADLAGIETMVGLFINTLPVRLRITPEQSLSDWLRNLQAEQVEARQYESTPLVQIQAWSDVPHGHTLFESLLVFQNYPLGASVVGEATDVQSRQSAMVEQTHYPLLLKSIPTSQSLILVVQYDDARFEATLITRILAHLQILLHAIVEHPEHRLGTLSLLSEQERQRLLVEWNRTQAPLPEVPCLQHLFEQQVQRTPEAVALVFEEEHLSYAILDRQANQFAHHLHHLGVGPEVLVGVCLAKSVAMALAVLGILKAGGAIVPLDPSYPRERLSFLMSDAHLSVLLTTRSVQAVLPEAQIPTILLDQQWEAIAQEPSTRPAGEGNADQLLYVIYTSGSTGIPKGVSLPHRALTNLLSWHDTTLSGQARTLQFAPLSFDASFHEMFAAWASGGTLCLVSEFMRRDVLSLAAFLSVMAIEKAILPVVMLHQLADEYLHHPRWLRSLREVIATGEQLQITASLTTLFEGLEQATLHNHYGPSETHVVTAYRVPGPASTWPTHPPIGRPIANTQIYLLDAQLQPVAIGVVGDLFVGGMNLARGYLGRPDLTAARFLPNPFSQHGGERLYQTGDLARYQADGVLEYLGRRDHQVKIRGYRVELGEIESLLHHHPDVREAVVLVHEETEADKAIVAYVVLNHKEQPTTLHEIRTLLQAHLPEYMLPAAFVVLETLPLTANGKVDHRALPKPESGRSLHTGIFVAARTPAEEVLAAIWAEILHVEPIGITDNFFELGGHSLRAVQVISRVRDAFQVEVPLHALFEHPTVEGLVQELAQLRGGSEIIDETAVVLQELEQLSDAEIEALLDTEE